MAGGAGHEGVAGGSTKSNDLNGMVLGALGCMSFIPKAFSFGIRKKRIV